MNDIWFWITQNYIELTGTIAGIAGALLTTRQIIWCWPVNLVNVACYIYVFFVSRNFAYFGLQIFYLVITLYGWYHWRYGGEGESELKVSRLSMKMFLWFLVLVAAGTSALGFILDKYTADTMPFLGSLLSISALICTFLSARKLLESYLIWIVIDMISIGMFMYQKMYPTVVLFISYTSIAVYGYYLWKKDYLKRREAIR